jgi:hypothetical protein
MGAPVAVRAPEIAQLFDPSTAPTLAASALTDANACGV